MPGTRGPKGAAGLLVLALLLSACDFATPAALTPPPPPTRAPAPGGGGVQASPSRPLAVTSAKPRQIAAAPGTAPTAAAPAPAGSTVPRPPREEDPLHGEHPAIPMGPGPPTVPVVYVAAPAASSGYAARTFTLQVPPNWPVARHTFDPRSGDETIRWTNPERTIAVTVTASTRPVATLLPEPPGGTSLDDVYRRIVFWGGQGACADSSCREWAVVPGAGGDPPLNFLLDLHGVLGAWTSDGAFSDLAQNALRIMVESVRPLGATVATLEPTTPYHAPSYDLAVPAGWQLRAASGNTTRWRATDGLSEIRVALVAHPFAIFSGTTVLAGSGPWTIAPNALDWGSDNAIALRLAGPGEAAGSTTGEVIHALDYDYRLGAIPGYYDLTFTTAHIGAARNRLLYGLLRLAEDLQVGARSAAAPMPVPTLPGAARVPGCRAANLRARFPGRWMGATGSLEGALVLTNAGATSCSLQGRPVFTFLAANGDLVPIVDRFAGRPPHDQAPIAVLPPGGQAAATLGWSNWCGVRSRPGFRRVRITLPAGAGTITLPESGTFGEVGDTPRCDGPLFDSELSVAPLAALNQEPGAAG